MVIWRLYGLFVLMVFSLGDIFIYHNRMYNIKVMKREHLWIDDCQGRTKVLGEKPICMSLLPSKIPHGLPWVQAWTTTLRS